MILLSKLIKSKFGLSIATQTITTYIIITFIIFVIGIFYDLLSAILQLSVYKLKRIEHITEP